MRARVKSSGPKYPVTAFGGLGTYSQKEWRPVPAGFEADAQKHPYLEIESEPVVPIEAVSADAVEPAKKPASKQKPGKSKV
jgi:hypothetical protein